LRASGTTSTNYNWNILNDNSFKLQSKNLANAYTTRFEISGDGQTTMTRLLTAGSVDMLTFQNDATNSLRLIQTYIGTNDVKWILTQKSNNVDYPIFNFRNGNICIGTTANPAYRIDLVGDINITGNYRVNSVIYKPANAVLADTATKLATGRNIAGALFDGTIDIAIDYNALNNKPLTVVP
jgi:hypothetical protein